MIKFILLLASLFLSLTFCYSQIRNNDGKLLLRILENDPTLNQDSLKLEKFYYYIEKEIPLSLNSRNEFKFFLTGKYFNPFSSTPFDPGQYYPFGLFINKDSSLLIGFDVTDIQNIKESKSYSFSSVDANNNYSKNIDLYFKIMGIPSNSFKYSDKTILDSLNANIAGEFNLHSNGIYLNNFKYVKSFFAQKDDVGYVIAYIFIRKDLEANISEINKTFWNFFKFK